jgi:hypothetical protein
MKFNYNFTRLTLAEKLQFEYLLLEKIEEQAWYAIIRFELLKADGFICIQ